MPVVRLRVLDGSTIELRDGVPRTRGECPTARPCPHIRCQYHLWLEAYKPHGNSATGRPARPTRLLPRWLESPLPPSCALDVAERVPPGEVLAYRTIAKLLGDAGARSSKRIGGIVDRIRRNSRRGGAR